MNATRSLFQWILRFVLLYVLFIVLFMIGSMAVVGVMPALATSEPGLVPATSGLLIVALADLLVIAALILTSRWSGWKLAVSLALAEQRCGQLRQFHRGQFDGWLLGVAYLSTAGDGRAAAYAPYLSVQDNV